MQPEALRAERGYIKWVYKFYKEAKEDFEIFGELNDGWEAFELGTNYEGFLARRRNKN